MAANVDSPKRRSARLQRGSPAVPDNRGVPRGPEEGGASTVSGAGGDVGTPQEISDRGDSVGRTDVQAASTMSRTPGGEGAESSGELMAGSSGAEPSGERTASSSGAEPSGDQMSGSLGTGLPAEGADSSSGACIGLNRETARPSSESAARSRERRDPSVVSPSRRLPAGPVRSADPGSPGPPPPRDSKVRCASKKRLQEVLRMCADVSRQILESDGDLPPGQRETHSFIWNFETALQDNVSVSGQPWHEAPDTPSEPASKLLEDRLDDAILETAMKRKRNPRKVLHHFVRGLKVQREILDRYKPAAPTEEPRLDSGSESRMTEQSAAAAAVSRQITQTMKALPAQLDRADGFSQVLSLQPLLQGSHLRQDIFSSHRVPPDPAQTLPAALETTPGDSEPAAAMSPGRSLRRRPPTSLHHDLYPLRSKRKISLEG